MHEPAKYDLDKIVRGVITVSVIALLYLLIRRLSGVLLPFVVSWFIAYLLSPMVDFFQHKCRMRYRGLAVAVTLLLVLLVNVLFALLIVPPMVEEMTNLSGYVHSYIAHFDASQYLSPALEERYEELIGSLDLQAVLTSNQAMSAAKSVAPHLWSALSGGVSALASLAVIFIAALYIIFILLDWDALASGVESMVPKAYRDKAQMVMSDISAGMDSYFRGQAKVASIVGVLFAVGFEIIGLPMAIGMGLLIGVLNMVPYLQTVAVLPCLLLGVLQSAETGRPLWVVIVCLLVVFLVVQALQDLVLTPRIMGKAMGLHPAIILLALSIWGSLLGIIGMIIALPLTTLMISYYKRFVVNK